ncbi:hypothetical protein HPP92_005278 [Vanilla planifolia]|uniref:Uncharacterized protein n=1 Tax=Vanilla planifolia TaxID=51239 RepID=A0A835RME9_VANPL|nr:hypothetical protein HPP92_005565 [Vanilla planifolia]KAG0494284.1 hypothetical protein HPP92_005278 [Vanilla planifolia]
MAVRLHTASAEFPPDAPGHRKVSSSYPGVTRATGRPLVLSLLIVGEFYPDSGLYCPREPAKKAAKKNIHSMVSMAGTTHCATETLQWSDRTRGADIASYAWWRA